MLTLVLVERKKLHLKDDEDAVDFANRVKKEIAQKGGLVDLEWDGMLKRSKVPPKLVARQQEKLVTAFSWGKNKT